MKEKLPTMLIVDDEMEVLKFLKTMFESRHWDVFIAPTAEASLKLLADEKIDLVLLDIRLPDKSGVEVLKEIKPKYPNLPVVILTGSGYDDKLISECLSAGAVGYVSKSAPPKELVEVVSNIIKK